MSDLKVDRREIGTFVHALFRYCGAGGYVNLRTFMDRSSGTWRPDMWRSPKITDQGLGDVITAAIALAELAGDADVPVVFCPPICCFKSAAGAAEKDVAEAPVLSIDCDTRPFWACELLENILGPATAVVASGGIWLDPASGAAQEKVHVHWRLTEPARDFADLIKLKIARDLAMRLVGADASAVPLVHPLRWPGSLHRKAEPRLARILNLRDVEIELGDALEQLREAADARPGPANGPDRAAGSYYTGQAGHRPSALGAEADIIDINSALAAIGNDERNWKRWSDIGMAIWRASDGSEAGYAAYLAWSSKFEGFDPGATLEKWQHFHKHPPNAIGAGTLFFLAKQGAPRWERPSETQRRLAGDPGEPPAHVIEPPPDDLAEGSPELGDSPEPPDDDDVELTQEEVEKRRAAVEATAEETLAAFNQHFAVVNEAGKCIVMKRTRDLAFEGHAMLERISFDDFIRMHLNRWIEVVIKRTIKEGVTYAIVKRKLAPWWLEHPRRRQYLGGVTFDPTNRAPADFLNLWRGFSVAPRPGDWSLLKDHIFNIICRGDSNDNEYVLNWLARLIQHPELAGEVALVIRSTEKGTGKSLFGRYIVRLFGRHGIHITHAVHLTGHFNAHLQDCCILFADEAFFAGDKTHEGALKGLITEHTLTVEGKYRNVVTVLNRLHLLIASNKDWVIPASVDERRFAVFEATDTRRGDRAYFAAIVQQMDNGGLAAMLYELQHRDISGFEVRDVPQTEALQAQKALSLSSIERWWLAVLERGFLWKSRHGAPWFTDWHDFYTTELLMRSYLQWCDETRPYDRKTREQLGAFFQPLYQVSRPRVEHPVYEIDSIDRRAVDVITDASGGVQTIPKSLDEIAIISKPNAYGYRVGELDEARDRLLAMLPGIPSPWPGGLPE